MNQTELPLIDFGCDPKETIINHYCMDKEKMRKAMRELPYSGEDKIRIIKIDLKKELTECG